jgi:hypothetical protein
VRAIFIRPESSNKGTAGNGEDMLLATATTPEAWHPIWRLWNQATGRPLGDKAFVQKLESLLGRTLLPAKRGPKPKPKDESPTLLDGN